MMPVEKPLDGDPQERLPSKDQRQPHEREREPAEPQRERGRSERKARCEMTSFLIAETETKRSQNTNSYFFDIQDTDDIS